MTELRHPELWRMHHVEGLSFGEIAKRTGLTREAVCARVWRMQQAQGPEPAPVSEGLLRLAAFDPLARSLVLERAPQLLRAA